MREKHTDIFRIWGDQCLDGGGLRIFLMGVPASMERQWSKGLMGVGIPPYWVTLFIKLKLKKIWVWFRIKPKVIILIDLLQR